MKIYFLRHEKRPKEQYFDVSLTTEGQNDAYNLKDTLKTLNLHQIYSSPFIRVLETIQSYLIDNYKFVNIEYALYEYVTNNWFNENNYNITLNKSQEEKYLVNTTYQSYFNIKDLEFPQDIPKITKRVSEFINYLIENYKNQDINILLCGHKKIFDVIIGNDKINYPMGGLSCIYENEHLYYKPINF
jgi:broad specificity phosphatase PhoE